MGRLLVTRPGQVQRVVVVQLDVVHGAHEGLQALGCWEQGGLSGLPGGGQGGNFQRAKKFGVTNHSEGIRKKY